MTEVCYLGLGANLDNPEQHVLQALQDIADASGLELLTHSSLYLSNPMGPQDQPRYVNAVACVATALSPPDLLELTQSLERQHGRQGGGQRWGARPLDLDILLYGRLQVQQERLTIPHPGLCLRSFVLVPLLEIAPDIDIPGKGLASQYVSELDDYGLQKLAAPITADNGETRGPV